MFKRDPIRSLSWALQCALQHDLLGVETPAAAEARKPMSSRRPREHECDVVLFGQVWSGAALGYHGARTRLNFEQDTTIVVGPAQDACVYVSTRLLYHVLHPNRRFYLDVAAHSMAPWAAAGGYEGRDDPITEAVDFELGAMLARLHAQVSANEPQRAALVASFLHRCAARFEEPRRPFTPGCCTTPGATAERPH
jgi:hypothetical protein